VKIKKKQIPLILITIGLLLIFFTYFYYPYIKNKQTFNKSIKQEDVTKKDEDTETNSFENLKYTGIYDLDKTFVIKSDKAYINKGDPDVVYMTNMHVVLYLKNNRTVTIVSEKGRYNKASYDVFFQNDVVATDGQTKIFAENFDLLATENIVKIYNNVSLNDPSGTLKADKINYDFESKNFKVSMFGDNEIKMKVIE